MSIKQAAKLAGISDTRWRQIEQGYRMYRGRREPEPPAPAPILARMAQAAGVSPAQLTRAGRPDAAAELAAMPRPPAEPEEMTLKEMAARLRHLEELLEGRNGNGANGGEEGNRDAV